MSRSKWKGPYLGKNTSKSLTNIKRNIEIVPKFIGLTFQVHNGKSYKEIFVDPEMVGHKFGEFFFTRAKFRFKKKLKKK